MGRYAFKLPDVGEGTAEVEIVKWHVAIGDVVAEDQMLVEVATDKAIVELPSPVAGTVVAVHGNEGETLPVGAELVVFELAREAGAQPALAPVAAPVVQAPAGTAPAVEPRGEKPMASPAVRRHARELDIALQDVHGSGPGGRITRADLDAHVAAKAIPAAHALPRASDAPREEIEEIKVIGVRRKIAQHLQDAKRRIPHFSYTEEVDMTVLESLRSHLNRKYGTTRARLTLLPFVIKALARALPAHPEMNARFDDDQGVVQRYRALHVGIATQTPNGLMVPVLRDAGTRSLWNCAAEIARIAANAREGRATRSELSGSTITITSLGPMGGVSFTPIINYPEVAIVGVNKLVERPVIKDGQVVVRTMMNLSSSFDHRVVDGWNAAAFVQALKQLLEQPAMLFIEEDEVS